MLSVSELRAFTVLSSNSLEISPTVGPRKALFQMGILSDVKQNKRNVAEINKGEKLREEFWISVR